MKSNLLVLLILNGFILLRTYELQVEDELTQELLNGYNSKMRPSKLVKGHFVWFLKQIEYLDEKNQVMVSSNYFAEYWNDQRLSWDPSNYSNITKILLPVTKKKNRKTFEDLTF
jgi:nicotinic acetylcholine receptor alpha-2